MLASSATYRGESRRPKSSDALHGAKELFLSARRPLRLPVRLAPGPNYKLYVSPEFVKTEAGLQRLKPAMVQVGRVESLENLVVPVADTIDPSPCTTVIVEAEGCARHKAESIKRPSLKICRRRSACLLAIVRR